MIFFKEAPNPDKLLEQSQSIDDKNFLGWFCLKAGVIDNCNSINKLTILENCIGRLRQISGSSNQSQVSFLISRAYISLANTYTELKLNDKAHDCQAKATEFFKQSLISQDFIAANPSPISAS